MVEFGENGAVVTSQSETSDYQTHRVSDKGYLDGPRSALGLFSVLRWSFYIYIIMELVLLAASATFTLYPAVWDFDSPTADPQIALLGSGLAMTGILYFGVFLFSAFMTARFTYRTMRNLHTVNSPEAIISPGWAVGWHFVPIANLFKPAQAMSQIYHGTNAAIGERTDGQSPISVWWPFWLISGVLGNISGNIPDYNSLTLVLDIGSAGTGIASALVLLRICRGIANRQELLKHGGVANVFA